MMLLTFLKIIGKVLFVILIIFVVLLCLVLFYPVGYKAKGSMETSHMKVKLRISWLFNILGVYFDYDNKELVAGYRILFFRRPFEKDALEREAHADDSEEDESFVNEVKDEAERNSVEEDIPEVSLYIDTAEVEESEGSVKANEAEESEAVGVQRTADECLTENIYSENHHDVIESEEDSHNKIESGDQKKKRRKFNGEKIKLSQKLQAFWRNIRRKRQQFVSGIQRIGKTKNKVTAFINDSRNQKALGHLKKEVFYLLKVICPKRLKLKLQFSTGDPAYTGILLGVLAMFPLGYQKKWEVTPDFEGEEAYAEGEFDVKGRILVFQLVLIVIRLFLDKECRRMYNKYMK